MTEGEKDYQRNEKLVLTLALKGLRANFRHEEQRLLQQLRDLYCK